MKLCSGVEMAVCILPHWKLLFSLNPVKCHFAFILALFYDCSNNMPLSSSHGKMLTDYSTVLKAGDNSKGSSSEATSTFWGIRGLWLPFALTRMWAKRTGFDRLFCWQTWCEKDRLHLWFEVIGRLFYLAPSSFHGHALACLLYCATSSSQLRSMSSSNGWVPWWLFIFVYLPGLPWVHGRKEAL